ncbi:TPA: hypothetical protein U1C30_000785 [Streptococcus suis]|nr:hypothetical protein [Streptococcus suis]HEM3652470.1 hypothetical protein [Streptococcus suis]
MIKRKGIKIMAFINATSLTDIIGTITELETVGYLVYSSKLDKTIFLTDEMYQELDKEDIQAYHKDKALKQCFEDFLTQWEFKKQEEK